MLCFTSCPDRASAAALARGAVAAGLAACVQLGAPHTAFYRWEGALEVAEECPLVFKCLQRQEAALRAHVCAQHPYRVPEWLVVETSAALPAYLEWMASTAGKAVPPVAD